jgi:hypothetical protein
MKGVFGIAAGLRSSPLLAAGIGLGVVSTSPAIGQ